MNCSSSLSGSLKRPPPLLKLRLFFIDFLESFWLLSYSEVNILNSSSFNYPLIVCHRNLTSPSDGIMSPINYYAWYQCGSFKINKGMHLARQLLCVITELGIPVGCSFLDTILPQYVADCESNQSFFLALFLISCQIFNPHPGMSWGALLLRTRSVQNFFYSRQDGLPGTLNWSKKSIQNAIPKTIAIHKSWHLSSHCNKFARKTRRDI